jgi:hypothetical protein
MSISHQYVLAWLENFTTSSFFWIAGIGLDIVFGALYFTHHWSLWWFIAWTIVMFLLAAAHAFWKTRHDARVQQSSVPQVAGPDQFNPDTYFTASYRSAVTEETAANMRAFAARFQNPQDREDFYLRLFGVGIAAYFYDETWWIIWRSQLLLLQRLNVSVLSLDEARTFYADAAKAAPEVYATYSYDAWLNFLVERQMILQQGTQLALTERGRDFLKYLIHHGRSADQRRL